MPLHGIPDNPTPPNTRTEGWASEEVGLADLEGFLAPSTPSVAPTGTWSPVEVPENEDEIRPEDLSSLVQAVQDKLILTGKVETLTLSSDAETNARQRRMVAEVVASTIGDSFPVLRYSPEMRERAAAAAVDYICGYGPIQGFLDDKTVSEVIVRGCLPVLTERSGVLSEEHVRFESTDQLLVIMRRIAREVGRELNEATPTLDAWLKDGSRVNCIIPPLTKVDGGVLTIRKFAEEAYRLSELVEMGSLPEAAADWLRAAIQAKVNLIVSGGTGAGKTAMLRALGFEVPVNEYLITIEDIWELRIAKSRSRVTELVTRSKGPTGAGGVTQRDLVVNALRMRPDRIIVGEVRGPECLDMLQSLSTGHDGGMSTVHANDVLAAISVRLPTLAAYAGEVDMSMASIQANLAIELIVQVRRTPSGKRDVAEIATIDPDPEDPRRAAIQTVWSRNGDELVQVGEPGPRVARKLADSVR